ncbi:hydroxyacylglutathione hydrolase [Asticcacaulis tiandongensis]|uniref:hydroxyacylglutathione hydrolase n=1 Tax=Asticcacaulis tiandongensis TaxID=2565365 RepID=UPI00319D96C2
MSEIRVMSLQIHPFPARTDNYGFLIRDALSGRVACIDTPDTTPEATGLIAVIENSFGKLDYILNTHWHPDHAGGNAALKARFGAEIFGPSEVARVAPLDQFLSGGDQFRLGETVFDIIDLGGHTLGHIGYVSTDNKLAFIGDCLFPLGCGRLFEGTPEQMWQSLTRLMALDPDTQLYCAHEYALSNLKFAESLGVDAVLNVAGDRIRNLRAAGQPTVPTRLGDEIAANPFLRFPLLENDPARQAQRFGELRAAKDNF